MTTQPTQGPKKPPEGAESTWQLKVLIATIAVGVLALILKTFGLF